MVLMASGEQQQNFDLRQIVLAVLCVAVVGAVLGSHALMNWVFELPLWLGSLRDGLLMAVEFWNRLMSDLGFAKLFPMLRDWFHGLINR